MVLFILKKATDELSVPSSTGISSMSAVQRKPVIDLKKGAFMPDEERRIIELHAKMGNKWARMAAEVFILMFDFVLSVINIV